jgi:hypothetical protein
LVQVRPLQQATVALHVWSRSAQVPTSVWQVPAVAPAGMLQPRPAQQSAATVQVSPVRWQYRTHCRESGSHAPEQQSPSAAHVWPDALQAVAAHFPAVQVPEQQSALLVQVPVDGMQAPPQRRTPWASGTHGARPQHCSRNWQTFPWAMQQAGSFPS